MSEHLSPAPDETPIRDLLVLAGRRPEPAPFRTARVRAAVEAEWRQSVRRRPRWRLPTLAAAVLVLTLLVLWSRSPATPPASPPAAPPLATIARISGAVQVSAAGSTFRPIAAGARLPPGTTVDAAGGRAVLTFDSGHSVRLDRDSRIVLEATTQLRLARGRIYVDSGEGMPSGDGLQIATTAGMVRDIGTQFEVDAGDAFVQVRVREGAVRVDQPRTSIDVAEGEAVRISPGGATERRAISPSGREWSWLDTIVMPFTLEGAELEAFLKWVSREQGLDWQFRDAAAARHAKGLVLHGSIEGLTPAEALEAVLPTCGMTFRLRGGTLIVGLAPDQARPGSHGEDPIRRTWRDPRSSRRSSPPSRRRRPLRPMRDRTHVLGRPVAEVLRELQSDGEPIIHQRAGATACVKIEPRAKERRDIAREILEPHGLTLKDGPETRGSWFVRRARRPPLLHNVKADCRAGASRRRHNRPPASRKSRSGWKKRST